MGYSYTPTYYSTLHDSITTLCKTILPFTFKKRGLPASEQKLSKLQLDNIKWQQDSFHQMLKLMGLNKEGILAESEVIAFKCHLLDTLIASPLDSEQPVILRDKLLFLQELLFAKCISEDEYHSSKRPILQRLAVQGAEIEARDVIVGDNKKPRENLEEEEEWSVIDLKDEVRKENPSSNSKNKSKQNSALKQIKGAASVFGFGKNREERSIFQENPSWHKNDNFEKLKYKQNETRSILMLESSPMEVVKETEEKAKRKPFKTLFQREQRDDFLEKRLGKSGKKQWGFDGFKKWKRNDSDDETSPLPLGGKSDSEFLSETNRLAVTNQYPIGDGPDTKLIKRKLHSDGSPSDFFIDKVLGDKIKKELSRIQSELSTTNPNLKFSDDQIEAISTNLPVEKADLKKFFPKSWCDRYGEVVLDVVKKEFKDHVGEMESMKSNNSTRWISFEDDENSHPNLFGCSNNNTKNTNNPFHVSSNSNNPFLQDDNPFWSPTHG